MYGAVCKKSTLLVSFLVDMFALAQECDHPVQHFVRPLLGDTYLSVHERVIWRKDELGTFATAALSQYPALLNVGIAEAL